MVERHLEAAETDNIAIMEHFIGCYLDAVHKRSIGTARIMDEGLRVAKGEISAKGLAGCPGGLSVA